MKIKHLGLIVGLVALTLAAATSCGRNEIHLSDTVSLSSPDGQLSATFGLTAEGQPCYRLDRADAEVVRTSRLGFDLCDGTSLKDGFTLEGTETATADETWHPVWGE